MYFKKITDEFEKLSSSICKLKKTVSCGMYPDGQIIPEVEMELLKKQLKSMKVYGEVLMKRIELLMKKMAKGD